MSTEPLLQAGFQLQGQWRDSGDGPEVNFICPRGPGLYAFVSDGLPRYIGKSETGLHWRMANFARSETLQTARRIRGEICALLRQRTSVDIYMLPLPKDQLAARKRELIFSLSPTWNRQGLRAAKGAD